MEYVKPILDIFRTNNIILYILFISSTIITFDFLDMRQRLSLDSLGKFYFALIGVVFLVSTSCICFLIINSVFSGLLEKVKDRLYERKLLKQVDETLNNLSNKEIVILSQYLAENTETMWMPMQGTEITSLVQKQILYLASSNGRGISNGMTIFHYSINPLIKDKVFTFLKELFDDQEIEDVRRFISQNEPS